MNFKITINRWVEFDKHWDILYWLCDQFGPENNGIIFKHELIGSYSIENPTFSTYSFINQTDATLFNLTWNIPGPRTLIFPTFGRLCGFPKIIPDDQLNRVKEWVIENGYLPFDFETYKFFPEK